MEKRQKNCVTENCSENCNGKCTLEEGRVIFTEEMKKTHTILIPMMLPIHFRMYKKLLELEGYKVELLKTESHSIIDMGLKYIHNDTCYPAQLSVGQLLDAVVNQGYDTDKIALLHVQTGGGCRASNYISMLRKALKKMHMEHIPVLSLNFVGLESNPGFKFDKSFIIRMAFATLYGDLLMNLKNQILPYEINAGETERVVNGICDELERQFAEGGCYNKKVLMRNTHAILERMNAIPVTDEKKVRVGIVGEIYVKFAPLGNNNLEAFLNKENCEVVLPGLVDFVLYYLDTSVVDYRLYGTGFWKATLSKLIYWRLMNLQNSIIRAYEQFPRFRPATKFKVTRRLANGLINFGMKMGEGWLLTAEMAELLESGVNNIVCTQPFGCLPNHIVGRGMFRKIKSAYPNANIVPIDYDASASRVNQENRIKLMLAQERIKV